MQCCYCWVPQSCFSSIYLFNLRIIDSAHWEKRLSCSGGPRSPRRRFSVSRLRGRHSSVRIDEGSRNAIASTVLRSSGTFSRKRERRVSYEHLHSRAMHDVTDPSRRPAGGAIRSFVIIVRWTSTCADCSRQRALAFYSEQLLALITIVLMVYVDTRR